MMVVSSNAADPHDAECVGNIAPSTKLESVTPSDSVNLGVVARQLYHGKDSAGDVTVVTLAGDVITFQNVPSGAMLGPFRVIRVNDTNTDAAAGEIIAFN